MKKPLTLFALTNIMDAAEGQSGLARLDQVSRSVLKFVEARAVDGYEVCVTDITSNPSLSASPVTLFSRIKGLCEGGWLLQSSSTHHHRRIALRLSAKARRELQAVTARVESELVAVLGKK